MRRVEDSPIRCHHLGHDLGALEAVLAAKRDDHWISALAGVTEEDLPARLLSTRVYDEAATEVFTDCFTLTSGNVKETGENLLNKFGLGLRRKHLTCRAAGGVVFALVHETRSPLSEQRSRLDDTDSRLSSHERLQRSALRFEHCPEARFSSQVHAGNEFYLTCFADLDASMSKLRIMSLRSKDGSLLHQMFERCLLAETPDCREACRKFSARHGLGVREQEVRAQAAPGCLALLLRRCAGARGPAAASSASASASQSLGNGRGVRVPAVAATNVRPVNGEAASSSAAGKKRKAAALDTENRGARPSGGAASSGQAPWTPREADRAAARHAQTIHENAAAAAIAQAARIKKMSRAAARWGAVPPQNRLSRATELELLLEAGQSLNDAKKLRIALRDAAALLTAPSEAASYGDDALQLCVLSIFLRAWKTWTASWAPDQVQPTLAHAQALVQSFEASGGDIYKCRLSALWLDVKKLSADGRAGIIHC
eukprot:TRINITY_DN17846_c0_g1_i1.p1 TRINITY_DN17846_c0_g1~~TRINITY_DN17846_c0_g1_i1.p1  ORF type:complete len:486 (+),score=97.75 TRINITY_DN17846_c0_g1_i1:259-1716(+)